MPRRRDARLLITLGCTDCRERTYPTSKNRRNDPQRLELRNSVLGAALTPCTERLGSGMVRSTSAPDRRLGGEATRRAFNFRSIGEILTELRRVTWPTREETTRLTIMVITVSAVVGLFLGAIDLGFAKLFGLLLGN